MLSQTNKDTRTKILQQVTEMVHSSLDQEKIYKRDCAQHGIYDSHIFYAGQRAHAI